MYRDFYINLCPNKFVCQNGECIASELLCDGQADCKDGSDETQAACSGPEMKCSPFAFRCAYGACVDGDLKCDGKSDCVDDSDELISQCSGSSTRNPINNTECSENEFRCDNGQCIDDTLLCDGHVDCHDGSDETYAKCSSFICPSVVFRCKYGACIDGNKRCDGRNDCADKSDEDPLMCQGSTSTTRPTISPPTRPTIVTPTWTPRPLGCMAPLQPTNGQWKLFGPQCPDKRECHISQGTELERGSRIVYSCNTGYKIEGSTDVYCDYEGKWSKVPTCVEIRCEALNTISTDPICSYGSESVPCGAPVLPGTTAALQCRSSYRKGVPAHLSNQGEYVRCNDNGVWEPTPIQCVPACGGITDLKPLIVNGVRPNITDFPWHATLYKTVRENEKRTFICGSTIIQENLVITAAHCVFDEQNSRVEDANKFLVAAGNLFRDYDSIYNNQNFVQTSEVKNIYIMCKYQGLGGNYALDIAILQLKKPFIFSAVVAPVCLDYRGDDIAILEYGNYGKVAGFGRTESADSSFVLQSITVPYIPYSQCISSSDPLENRKFNTADKFCAGYTNGSSVCDGDSGGGLVFKTQNLWYLRGIVSVGMGTTTSGGIRSCDSHAFSLYTKVSTHTRWIQSVIYNMANNNPIQSCNTNS
ncbi:modular serine protease isoform X2 [Cephus cinctus]|uniref:Modular serine protease isoform X2 n=1 Tax=Cephus cinctus TaxID=211228 RepID=A0AAJ7RKB5_CEPCN|nr:modular serine protease isoform X2 [Cephus cinctus]